MNGISRRVALAGMATVGTGICLASCRTNPDGNGAKPSVTNGGFVPPKYVPFDGIVPDLPGTDDGVSPGFFNYPEPVARDGIPLPETDTATGLFQGVPASIAPDRNPAYASLRALAGNRLDGEIVSSNYLDKFQVTIASNNIPDFVQVQTVRNFPELLASKFADLSDVLGGEAVTEFPALASIPTASWRIPQINGRLWGIPQPRPPAGTILNTRGDLLAAKGIDPSPELRDGEDFLDLLETLTERGKNQFALGADPVLWLLPGLLTMLEAPNQWQVIDGRFVSQIEVPQMSEALEIGAKIIRDGLMHPNSFASDTLNGTWFRSGVTSLIFQGFTGWQTYLTEHPEWNSGYVRLPKWNGGGPAPIQKGLAGYGAFVAIRKQESDTRLKELLRLADLLSSPFGTAEYLTVNYGAEGETFSWDGPNPVYLPDQKGNVVPGWTYCGGQSKSILFGSGNEDVVRRQHEYLAEVIPDGRENDSSGLHSETALSKGASWTGRLKDAQRAILRGEQPVSSWAETAKVWKDDVGDKIAAEYAESASI